MEITESQKPGQARLRISLPARVIVFLVSGLLVGLLFRESRAASALYTLGTYFPKAVVTCAALIIFTILSGATAKLVLFHRRRAGRLFGLIFVAYLSLGVASLVYVAIWIPILTGLRFSVPGAALPGLAEWLRELGRALSTLLSDQPLIQTLVGAIVVGSLTATVPALLGVAHGLVAGGDFTLRLFKKLLWYYPIMVGCLAIGIPLKFGLKGMTAYGQTTLWVGLVTVSWSVVLVLIVKLTTTRTLRQIASYYASVWTTGFGTGGSYETLAMNIVSAERDLGLLPDVAEVSIVFGTVMNKSCATMSVMLVTITVARLMNFPISMAEILTLIPPVLILGLESPGIPGGAAFFMSPIVAVLLRVGDVDGFVSTFLTMYSGLIPMFATAGNTTNDGLMGAFLNDRFAGYTRPQTDVTSVSAPGLPSTHSTPAARVAAWGLMAAGVWMLVSPQALMGLQQLKWMHDYAFRGEALLGGLLLSASLYLLNLRR